MAGEDSELEKMCPELAGTHFTIEKKIPMKFPESKRSAIEKIAEFRGIPNGFPNLGANVTRTKITPSTGSVGNSIVCCHSAHDRTSCTCKLFGCATLFMGWDDTLSVGKHSLTWWEIRLEFCGILQLFQFRTF